MGATLAGSLLVIASRWWQYRRSGRLGSRRPPGAPPAPGVLREDLLAAAAIAALAAIVLLLMGRTPWGPRGAPGVWTADTLSRDTSQRLADPYAFTHILHGTGLYALLRAVASRVPLGLRLVLAVGMEAVWEVFENTHAVIRRYRAATISLEYFGDSVLNSVGDILASALGFGIAARLPACATVIGVVLVEVGLLLWVRDSLTLNILMLIYPIDAVRAWQAGG